LSEEEKAMQLIEVLGQVDDQRLLRVEVPASVPTGTVKVVIELPDQDDDTDLDEWAAAISRTWAGERNDQ
jgi:hypothetical protein